MTFISAIIAFGALILVYVLSNIFINVGLMIWLSLYLVIWYIGFSLAKAYFYKSRY